MKTQHNIKTMISVLGLTALALVACQPKAESVAPDTKGTEYTKPEQKVNFAVWKELVGIYQLTQFNGKDVSPRHSEVEKNVSSFYDLQAHRYLETIVFPLYSDVGTNYEQSFDFGPISEKGTTTLNESKNIRILTYKFDGPINADGRNVEMHLDMTVVKEDNNLYVTYTLEIPNHIPQITRNFTLQKRN